MLATVSPSLPATHSPRTTSRGSLMPALRGTGGWIFSSTTQAAPTGSRKFTNFPRSLEQGNELDSQLDVFGHASRSPHMIAAGAGHVICISSVEGNTNPAGYQPLHHKQTCSNGFVKAVAVKYGPQGITSNAICPGGSDGFDGRCRS